MIELELKCELGNAADASNPPLRKVNRLNFGLNKLHMAQNAAERIDNIARIKIAGGDLVQHRREQDEILAADQSNFCVCATRQRFVQVHCRAQPGKSTTRNITLVFFIGLRPEAECSAPIWRGRESFGSAAKSRWWRSRLTRH